MCRSLVITALYSQASTIGRSDARESEIVIVAVSVLGCLHEEETFLDGPPHLVAIAFARDGYAVRLCDSSAYTGRGSNTALSRLAR